jgi:hypothetical protein
MGKTQNVEGFSHEPIFFLPRSFIQKQMQSNHKSLMTCVFPQELYLETHKSTKERKNWPSSLSKKIK